VRGRDLLDLLLLAALWGASFLFMRIAAPQFGPVPLMAVRCAIGALVLLPLLAWRGEAGVLRQRPGCFVLVGTLNSALPFVLFGFATLSLTAGFASLLNATVPLWAALVAYLWLAERPSRRQLAGLAVGFAGVAMLVAGRGSIAPGGDVLAIAAALAATLSYGIAAAHARRHMAGTSSLALAAGSQLGAIAVLAVPGLLAWPERSPDASAWAAALALGAACTGLAYILYFRLLNRVGAAGATSVTFLIPVFGVLWGTVFLGERPTAAMLAGGMVILVGTAIAAGVRRPFGRRAIAPEAPSADGRPVLAPAPDPRAGDARR
jgi:drug/metabolite transporter (DMT)-like permease